MIIQIHRHVENIVNNPCTPRLIAAALCNHQQNHKMLMKIGREQLVSTDQTGSGLSYKRGNICTHVKAVESSGYTL